MHFVRGCESLDKEQIAVYVVQGNHDPADSWKRHMPLPKNVHIFSSERVERFSASSARTRGSGSLWPEY